MVEIQYVDGSSETVETVDKIKNHDFVGHFLYDENEDAYVIFDNFEYENCMRVSREFVKSIKYIALSNDRGNNFFMLHRTDR